MLEEEPEWLAHERAEALGTWDHVFEVAGRGVNMRDWMNGDVVDHLDELDPADRDPFADPPAAADADAESELDESWARVDLGPALRGDVVKVTPSVLRCDDGRCMFYAGRTNEVHADSGEGKSWAADIAAAQDLHAGHHVIWIDFEDDELVITERLRILDVDDDVIAGRFHYYRPTAPFDAAAVTEIERDVQAHDVTLIVVDSLGEAFGIEGVDEDRDVQVGPWLRRVARRLADAGPAVLIIDHSTKAKDNPLFPSGSKRKRAAITGASYLLQAPQPLTREKGGRLTLTCAKDRHGHYRRGEIVAEIVFTVYPDGGMTVHVWPPDPAAANTNPADALSLRLRRAAVQAAKAAGEPLSQRRLLDRIKVKASLEKKRAAIEEAVADGALRTEDGPRRTVLHTYVRDLRNPDDTDTETTHDND